MSSYITELRERPTDPLGGASGEKREFNVTFLGKANNPNFPFTIANEVIAAHIGQSLGLNVPSVFTHQIGGEPIAFVQMIDRAPEMKGEPPVTAKALQEYVASHAYEVHGAIVYDLFLANNDRAFGPVRRNLFLTAEGRLLLFDQGNACFYRRRPDAGIEPGIARLEAVREDLGKMFDMAHKENHYVQFLSDWELVDDWCSRIAELPDFLLQGAVDRVPTYVERPTGDEREAMVRFLTNRKSSLLDHIIRRQDLFPGLPPRGSHD